MDGTRPDTPPALEEAILRTVAYGDVFDSPMTPREIHRYLERVPASQSEVDRAIQSLINGPLTGVDGYVCLMGREALADLRRRREEVATQLWPEAVRCGRAVARLPWVRMVGLTGALAMNNVDRGADVDLLIVTGPGRVWLCRFLVIQMVRLFRLRGVEMCPNWLLSTERLELEAKDFHSARELAQMVPLAGAEVYGRMRELNRWAEAVLPNAVGPPRDLRCAPTGSSGLARWAEWAFGGRFGSVLEGWMARRKIREIRRTAGDNPEVVLDRHQCKGHVDAHGRRISETYADRLESLSLSTSWSVRD